MDYFECFRQVWQPNFGRGDAALQQDRELTLEAINEQYRLHRHGNLMRGDSVPAYNDKFKISAYMYKYAYHHSKIMKNVFQQILDSDTGLQMGVGSIFYKSELNICSLGGAAGISNVGIMDVLSQSEFFCRETTVNNTSVDLYGSWKIHFETVMEYAGDMLGLYGGQDVFLTQNLLIQNWHPGVNYAVENADVICMNKFLSYVYRKDGYVEMLRKIFRFAKSGCIIILLDNDYNGMLIPPEMRDELKDMCVEILQYYSPFASPMPNIEANVRHYFRHYPLLSTNQNVKVWVKS